MITNKSDTKDFLALIPEGETHIPDIRNQKYEYVFRKNDAVVLFAHVKVMDLASNFGMYQVDCNVIWSIRRSINNWLAKRTA